VSDAVIITEGLSKQYRLGAAVHGRLTESLWRAMAGPARRFRSKPSTRSEKKTIWALRDVSIEVHAGEVVGIIGRNGAGKSTLLKILSRITEPTSGYVELEGRVGSLLEVGSGFHQDLTGRENVYLYGAILGMRRSEVKRKFDEIVSFAEVDEFLDTPVKRYSSGMYMRLAFAVAAHLEPEILLVDEVLAVGDLAFQRKCLGKMENVARGGRTVVFVSHNIAAVTSLCDRTYLLENGQVERAGPTKDVIQHYVTSTEVAETRPLAERHDRGGDGSARLTSLRLEDADGRGAISCGSGLKITLDYTGGTPLKFARFVVTVYDALNFTGIFRLDSDAEPGLPEVLPAEGQVTITTEPIAITPGRCRVNVALYRGGVLADHVGFAGAFDVEPDDYYETGRLPRRSSLLTLRRHQWSAEKT
jgi:lipopolysaccharide transport system ATP-binding protein